MSSTSFWALVEQRAADTPDALFSVDEGERRLSFADYRTLALRCAAGLAERGVEADTAVSWSLPTWTDAPESDATRWLFFTSGTTADPKGVLHTDETLLAASMGLRNALALQSDARGDAPGLRPVTGLEHWLNSRFFRLSNYHFENRGAGGC